MIDAKSTALFGGALMAAGVTTANAQSFIYAATDSTGNYSSFAYSYIVDTGAYDYSNASGNLNTYATGYSNYFGSTTAWTSQTANSMRVAGVWDGGGYYGYGYGGNIMQQFFQVDQDAQLLIEWDFTGTDAYVSGFILEDPGGAIFTLDGLLGDPLMGSELVPVSAGQDYGIVMGMNSGAFPFYYDQGAEQYINVTLVPAPASVALLAGAGVVAIRRRR